MVRLVKGAYWDTEVKRAQERGLADYPVFTRKAMTDLCYLDCARKLLAARARVYPQFATHNALTVATIIEEAGAGGGYEFQRLHGMGEALYRSLREDMPTLPVRVYAPVGGHADLLAYLVRRLLENGANSSFVALAGDKSVPISQVIERPEKIIAAPRDARHPNIPLPRALYEPERENSDGVEFGHRASLEQLRKEIRAACTPSPLQPRNPPDAMTAAQAGFAAWNAKPVAERAATLERTGDLIETERGRLIALLQSEGGKTLDDCVSEVRETVDYCRYYAAQARSALSPKPMPGPTGESNELHSRGRGVFVCISPWNFPLAIFSGQVVAALAAGNAVVAKPAEQTPRIAGEAIRLLHRAGVPENALQLVVGDGEIGAALVADKRTAGVAFTGSTEVGRAINRALAAKDGPIVPLIAETGGINAMIADATALPEQITDDVITSAFRSAGQRCSALRLLCVQDDVADRVLTMIAGAARELVLGDPRDPATQVGPVIDAEAHDKLMAYLANMEQRGALRFRWDQGRKDGRALPPGNFVPPSIVELKSAKDLTEEVFGPVLHVVRWRARDLDRLIDDIAGNGYGLTLGIHSRIDATVRRVIARLDNGNVYVNRSMIGAVVGTQPFGGSRLSGTGPKAGGPNYLHRFALEQVVTVNTAAAGGNAALLNAGS
jgi:RHH-type proline utilization regulon transcriptional repressor/proline dehydrogenase/delta 1-pyrroline-5-carboxylate dehydrogenase